MSTPLVTQLVTLRKSQRVTQGEMAEDFGVAQGTISRWETGDREITDTDLAEYARILGAHWVLATQEQPMEDLDALAAAVANGEGWPVEVEEK